MVNFEVCILSYQATVPTTHKLFLPSSMIMLLSIFIYKGDAKCSLIINIGDLSFPHTAGQKSSLAESWLCKAGEKISPLEAQKNAVF